MAANSSSVVAGCIALALFGCGGESTERNTIPDPMANAGSGGTPGAPSGPTEQWSCATVYAQSQCDPVTPIVLSSCTRDASRPTSDADCPPDTQFTCLQGAIKYLTPDDLAYPQSAPFAFNCECTPQSNPCTCPTSTPCGLGTFPAGTCSPDLFLCTCAGESLVCR